MIIGDGSAPEAPRTRIGWSSLSTMVGDMLERGLFFGAMALAAVPISPKLFGTPRLSHEVIHFVVENDPGLSCDEATPKAGVYGGRQCHCIASIIHDAKVRGPAIGAIVGKPTIF